MSERSIDSGRIAVLIIDPNPISRRALSALLEEDVSLHVLADAASPGQLEAADVARADVAIIGESDAGPAGVIEALRGTSEHLKVIVMAHFDGGETPFQAIQQGADGLVPISAGAEEIVEAILTVIETGTAIDPELAVEALRWAASKRDEEDLVRRAPQLTARESEILEHLAEGRTAASIASRLGLSRRTVEAHLANAYRKLGVHGRFEALARIRSLTGTGASS